MKRTYFKDVRASMRLLLFLCVYLVKSLTISKFMIVINTNINNKVSKTNVEQSINDNNKAGNVIVGPGGDLGDVQSS